MRIAVAIPTYNEKNNLLPLIKNVNDSLAGSGVEPYFVVVDDNSPDGTAELVKKEVLNGQKHLHLIQRPKKAGLGSAYVDAFRWILSNYPTIEMIVQMDADLSHPPYLILNMIDAIRNGADAVIASRYIHDGGVDPGWPLHRRITSKGANMLARAILGIKSKDVTSGFRAYRISIVKELMAKRLSSKGYEFQVETLYVVSKLTARIEEIPFQFKNRMDGKSKLTLKEIMRFLKTIITIKLNGQIISIDLSNAPDKEQGHVFEESQA